jgi:hypothetical protein
VTDLRTLPFDEAVTRFDLEVARLTGSPAASEGSYYPALTGFLERVGAQPILLPRGLRGGLCPDLQVRSDAGRVVGYIEAKLPGTDLKAVAESRQLRRYKEAFPNLLLTDFREVVLFRDGDRVAVRWTDSGDGLRPLLYTFLSHDPAPVRSAGELAKALAHRTRHLKDMIEARLARELEGAEGGDGDLAGFYRAFSEHLIAKLSPSEFADLYAQTLAFGLFAARTRFRGGEGDAEAFGLATATAAVPETVGILRDAFRYISIADPPEEVGWILHDLVDLLRAADVDRIFRRWFHEGRGGDPIVHFYETFLERYDSGERERRGVYYTPLPLVSYVTRSVHRLLIRDLGLPLGLADERVRLLDPAAGTLPFVTEAWKVAREAHAERFGEGAAGSLRRHLLGHFGAFELMMAPYAVGHLKIGYLLREWGIPLTACERFPLYLTNTLEGTALRQSDLPGMASLTRESVAAERLKKETPEREGATVCVVVGNPPYRGHSANKDGWIDELIREGYERPDGSPRERRDDGYYRVEGKPLGERNPKWLRDDYVKFLRFAQWKVDREGQGVVGLVLNHGYLDNPTFRGLRESLLQSFDRLYLLDLHGNPVKTSTTDAGRDENVFSIKQGVSVALLVKARGSGRERQPAVFRADLRGGRREKLAWLAGHDAESTGWMRIDPRAPHFLFQALDPDVEARYRRFVSLTEVFPVRSVGVITGRDDFALARSWRELQARFAVFAAAPPSDPVSDLWSGLRRTRTWDPQEALRAVREDDDWKRRIVPILYRPFDTRWIFYSDAVVERPRRAVMEHMLRIDNLGLVVPRQGRDAPGALVTDTIAGHKSVSAYDINSLFPLWRVEGEPDAGTGRPLRQAALFGGEGSVAGLDELAVSPNVAAPLADALATAYGGPIEPADLMAYVYAVLQAPTYRTRYAAPLERDFPRVPFPKSAEVFRELAALGRRLIDLHLLRARELDTPSTRLDGPPGPVTLSAKPHDYRPGEGRVVVTADGHAFTGIPPEVWHTDIGGHQVLRRWLRERARSLLTREEIETFCRTATALTATLALHGELDRAYERVEAGGVMQPGTGSGG